MMANLSQERWSLLSGVIFVILLLAAVVLVGQYTYMPSAEEVSSFFSSSAGRISVGGYLGTVSAFFLLWFAGSVRGVLRRSARESGSTADIAFGGGVAAGVLVAVAFSGILALAQRAGSPAGIGPDAAVMLNDSWSQVMGLAMPVAFAAFSGATGVAVLRTKLLPAWFGWLSLILAAGLLTPFSYAVLTLGIVWTAVLSIWLFARTGREGVGTHASLDTVEGAA